MAVQQSSKLSLQDAHYTSPGMYPFTCGTCTHLQKDNSCELVDGPDGGKVNSAATCSRWQPNLGNR